jgi:hypothetical protein
VIDLYPPDQPQSNGCIVSGKTGKKPTMAVDTIRNIRVREIWMDGKKVFIAILVAG